MARLEFVILRVSGEDTEPPLRIDEDVWLRDMLGGVTEELININKTVKSKLTGRIKRVRQEYTLNEVQSAVSTVFYRLRDRFKEKTKYVK